jgi:hypothetical protein
VLDDSTRRLLRFSLFLQGFALLMMGGAFVIRVAAIGWEPVAFLLGGLSAVISGAMVFTVRRLRAG